MADPPQPEFPFLMVVTDFCDIKGNQYIIYADRYSGWTEVALMCNTTVKTTCSTICRWFTTYGVPDELGSDGGPPFESQELLRFLHDWGVRKRTTSAYYPQSNGRAELAVKYLLREY